MKLSEEEILARRTAAQLLRGRLGSSAERVVARLGGIQAQDIAGAKWSIGIRLSESTAGSVEQALANRRIVRTWAFRGTLHLLAAADVPWLLTLLAPTVFTANRRRYRELELEENTFTKSNRLMEEFLNQRNRPVARSEICAMLEKKGVSAEGQRAPYLLQRAALERILCLGPIRGREATYELLSGKENSSPTMDPVQARAELAERYFAGHGPATVGDFCWWSGLPAAAARQAIENGPAVRAALTGNEPLWIGGDRTAADYADLTDMAFFLPPFDEYLLGYRDRKAVLDPAFTMRVNAGGGMMKPTILLEGRIAGIWKPMKRKGGITMTIDPFRALSEREYRNLERAAERYGAFHNAEAELLK